MPDILTIVLICTCLSLLFITLWCAWRAYKLKKLLVKQNHAVSRCEEMLYASKDGYLTSSIYNNKEQQHCSRRLATLLNLKNGEKSTAEEVFGIFLKADTVQLTSSFNNLKKNGMNFEMLAKTKNNRTFIVNGSRVSSMDDTVNCNCLWFKDITKTTEFIDCVTEEAYACRKQMENYRILIDNLPCPVWMHDAKLNMTILNRGYLNLLGLKDFKDVTPQNSVIHDLGNTTNIMDMTKTALESNTPQKKQITILTNGNLKKYEITETPHYDSSLKTSHIIGSLIDISEFDEAKRNYQVHLDSHLEILSSLDTAFCIINIKHNFTFGNTAFLKLWNLPADFLDKAPHYNTFLDKIREQKILPEVSDFRTYKEEENSAFDALTEQREDLLYIPDGRTIRRLRAPHPDGTIIAYEDITDRLATERRLSDLITVQQNILDNINDGILIFSPQLKLKYYNTAFLEQWQSDAAVLDNQPSLREMLDRLEEKLPETKDWKAFREDMQKHLTTGTPFTLKLKNNKHAKVTPFILADTSLMITSRKE